LDKFSVAFVSSHGNENASINDKLNEFKNNLFQQLDARRIASKLDEKYWDKRWLIVCF
jgi:hypothetical protein